MKGFATWPAASPGVDDWWENAVAAEPERDPDDPVYEWQEEIDTRPAYLVKPQGSLDDLLLVWSFYPAFDTAQLEHNTVGDVSSQCLNVCVQKRVPERLDVRNSGALLVDFFPHRIPNKGLNGKPRMILYPSDNYRAGRHHQKKSAHFERLLGFWSNQILHL